MPVRSPARKTDSPASPSLPTTMKAAVVESFDRPLVIKQLSVPEPGPDQVLIQVKACGVCHTDLHAARGHWPVKPAPPFVPGHEGVGVVVAMGDQVRGIALGDRVGAPWLHSACGACEYCGTGWETLCHSQQNTGYSVDGGFAEYLVADFRYVGRLPDGLGFGEAAPLLCAGVTVYKGLKETEVRPGQWVVISGVGGLGHLAVQYARAMGMHCAAVDIAPEKLELAKASGAELVVNAATEDAGKVLQDTVGGAHGVLVTAVSPDAITQALSMVRRKATVALVGLPPGSCPLPIFPTVLNRTTIRGSIVGTRQDLAEALQFGAEGKVKPHFRWAGLDDVNAIFCAMEANEIDGRVVLRMDSMTGADDTSDAAWWGSGLSS